MWLNCSRNLIVSLDLTGNTVLDMLEIEGMPSLISVCVAQTLNLGINFEGTKCSFIRVIAVINLIITTVQPKQVKN